MSQGTITTVILLYPRGKIQDTSLDNVNMHTPVHAQSFKEVNYKPKFCLALVSPVFFVLFFLILSKEEIISDRIKQQHRPPYGILYSRRK